MSNDQPRDQISQLVETGFRQMDARIAQSERLTTVQIDAVHKEIEHVREVLEQSLGNHKERLDEQERRWQRQGARFWSLVGGIVTALLGSLAALFTGRSGS